MATPTQFERANMTWRKPGSMDVDECGDLPAFFDGKWSVSCWALTWRERFRVLVTGCVWLGCCHGQPPVWIQVDEPFNTGEQDGEDKEQPDSNVGPE